MPVLCLDEMFPRDEVINGVNFPPLEEVAYPWDDEDEFVDEEDESSPDHPRNDPDVDSRVPFCTACGNDAAACTCPRS